MAVVVAAGLFSRSRAAVPVLPDFVRTYAGDTLWALLVFLLLGIFFPRARTVTVALAALGIAFAVEASQLYQADWLNRIRATRLGALVLGAGWVASDLVCYTAGVALGAAAEVLTPARRRGSGGR
jgi:hypothetical protein